MKAENDDSSGEPNPSLSQNGNESSTKKRRRSPSNDERTPKIQKITESCRSEEIETNPESSNLNLLSLSDDVLLIIMSNLKAVDLMSLRKSCQRLAEVASDWSLWINVDFRPSILEERELLEYLPLLRDTTETIATRGFASHLPTRIQCLSKDLLSKIGLACQTLKKFVAEEHYIDAHDIQIAHFPSSLKHLSLKSSQIKHLPVSCSYFFEIHIHLPHLQVVELSDCTWFPSHSIMALSKLPRLEELRLDGCRRLKECMAYASLAFNHGFKELQILDLRRTGFSDSELPSINRYNRLTHLYLERSGSRQADPDPGRQSPTSSSDDEADNDDAHSVSDNGLRSLVVAENMHMLFNHAFNIRSNEIIVTAPVKDRVSRCRLHTLVVRHFPRVSDATLDEMRSIRSLRFLDLTGTVITKSAAMAFRESRPEVTLITSFDNVT